MPISIECILESAVFFPGDTIFCRIFISNLGGFNSNDIENVTSSKQTQREQSISWITAQVYGNLMVESSFIKLNSNTNKSNKIKIKQQQQQSSQENNNNQKQQQQQQNQQQLKLNTKQSLTSGKKFTAGVSSATSLPNLSEIGENGKPIFTSPTTFLASELYIPPGQTKSFIYYLTLPSPLPPSFKGTSLKYSYFLSIASQVYTNPAQILTVPLRILTPASALRSIKFKSNMTFDFEEGSAETTQEYNRNNLEVVSKWPISPFKKSQYFPLPYPQNLSQYDSNNTKKSVIDILNKHSTPVSIVISKGTDKLATFSICKTAFSLGDSVHGTFDFSIATIPCFKVLIKLECEEIVDSKYLQSTRGSNKPIRKLYGELHEFTTNLRQTHFIFHIPVEASPEFSTKYVSVKWSLRFEFVTPIKSSYTPYQPTPSTTNTNTNTNNNNNNNNNSNNIMVSSRSNSSNNLPILISPPNTPAPLSSTPTSVSPIKSSTNNLEPSHINKNNHSRNNSVENLNQQQQQQHHQQHLQQQRDNINRDYDDDDNHSSSHSENAIINDDTLSNSSSNFSSSTNNSKLNTTQTINNNITNNNNNNINNQTQPNQQTSSLVVKKKKLFPHPNIGVLRDDGSVPLVDTLHWSLPIRVLVGFPPHELLHTNKNELIL
ncbi:hypothetical protein ACTFIV_001756 [Dictyostelium citrinum]